MLWSTENSTPDSLEASCKKDKQSRKFVLFFCLALILTLIIAVGNNHQTNSAENSSYSYLARVFDLSFATTQTDKNVRQDRSKNNLGFMVSYAAIDSTSELEEISQKVAFTYDNAVAALAFIAADDRERAKQIVDTLVAAQRRDRAFLDGRIRNAYKGGRFDPSSTHFLLPGRYNAQTDSWQESESHVSTHTVNVAWAMLALLGYYESYGGDEYFQAAIAMGRWIEGNCRDGRGAGGYTGGYTGWETQQQKLSYKSTEHNLDLYAVFARLYLLTGKPVWQERANHAKNFVLAMWNKDKGHFWTGTEDDGVTIYREVIPLDAQTWTPLALKAAAKSYLDCLEYVEQHHALKRGFDFNQDRDGVWYEGTAQMALAYRETDRLHKAQVVLAMLKTAKQRSGAMPTTDRITLTTGFIQPDGTPWLYFRSLHIGATAWTVLAERGVNPFWLGSSK